jgi:hypothetical protein
MRLIYRVSVKRCKIVRWPAADTRFTLFGSSFSIRNGDAD